MQSASTIDPLVLRELHPGEQLLWWARPDAQKRVTRETNVSRHLTAVVVLGIAVAFTLIIFFSILRNFIMWGSPDGASLVTFLIFLLCIAFLIFRFILVLSRFDPRGTRLLRNTVYAITNQRIIVITVGKTYNVISQTPDQIGQLDRLERPDGWGDIIYGIGRSAQIGTRTVVRRAALAGIPDVRGVEALLVRTFKQPAYTPPPARQETYGEPAAPYTSYPQPQE